jgi:hypothetical protein
LSKEPNKKHQKVKWMAEEKEKYLALTANKMAQDWVSLELWLFLVRTILI